MTKIVVIGPNCWGAGETFAQAMGRAQANRATFHRGPMDYNSYRASDDFTVDSFGAIEARELVKLNEVRHVNGERQLKVFNKPVDEIDQEITS